MKKQICFKFSQCWFRHLAVSIMLLLCATAYAQDKKFDLILNNVSLEKAFDEVEKKTDYRFMYNQQDVNIKQRITVNLVQKSIHEIIAAVLTNVDVDYQLSGKQVVLSPKQNGQSVSGKKVAVGSKEPTLEEGAGIRQASASSQPAITVRGVVLDEEGFAIPLAVISLKNSTKYTIADEKGGFELSKISPEAILIVSCLGYESAEYSVNGKSSMQVKLRMVDQLLDELVITGYQTISRDRSAGSFAKVSSSAIESRITGKSVIQRLEGITPGLVVNNSSGSDKYLIRGVTSVNNSREPLFVLDGVPLESSALDNLLNPNDVESVTILRDATAASIWGARAANGVIVISTKKGFVCSKVNVKYSGYYTHIGKPDMGYQKMMSSKEFVGFAREEFDPEAYPWSNITVFDGNREPYVLKHEQILYDLDKGAISQGEADKQLQSLADNNNGAQIEKYFMQPAFLMNHSISLNGGTDVYRFYGSLNYTGNQYFNKDNKRDAYHINFRQDVRVAKWLNFDLTTNMSYQKLNNQPLPLFPNSNNLVNHLPYELFADAAGKPLSHSHLYRYTPYREKKEKEAGLNFGFIPLNEMRLNSSEGSSFYGRLSVGLTVNLLEGLRLEGRYQYQKEYETKSWWNDQNSYYVREELGQFTKASAIPGGKPTYALPTTGGHFKQVDSDTYDWTVRHQLSYDSDWNDGMHQISTIAGVETRDRTFKSTPYFQRGYDKQTLVVDLVDEKTLANGFKGAVLPQSFSGERGNRLATPSRRKDEATTRYFSIYFNGGYTFINKYSLNASMRIDQSNLFGTDKSVRWKPIWSVGGAWNAKEEGFLKESTVINRLNLRLSYGLGGNAPQPGYGGPFDILRADSNPLMPFPQYLIVTPGNRMLVWERTATINVGFDAMLFNRVAISLDLYNKNTTDLLNYQPTDPTSGFASAYNNIGSLYNRGFELSVNSTNIVWKNFSWNSMLNLSYNYSKIRELKSEMALNTFTKTFTPFLEGSRTYSLYGYKWAGLNAEGNPTVYNAAGDAVVQNMDDLDAMEYLGVTQPPWTAGFTNVFTYKNLSLSFMMVFNLGHVMIDDNSMLFSGRLNSNFSQELLNRWKAPGDELKTGVPKYIPLVTQSEAQRNLNYFYRSTDRKLSASYIKVREITFSYALPLGWIKKARLDQVVVRGQVTNPLSWFANDKGVDPEYYNLRAGWRTSKMKQAYTLGVDVIF